MDESLVRLHSVTVFMAPRHGGGGCSGALLSRREFPTADEAELEAQLGGGKEEPPFLLCRVSIADRWLLYPVAMAT